MLREITENHIAFYNEQKTVKIKGDQYEKDILYIADDPIS